MVSERPQSRTNASQADQGRIVVGWREWVSLPDLGLLLKAKVDSGARTSTLHAFELEEFERDGRDMVRFSIHPIQNNMDQVCVCEAELVDMRMVSDSGGHRELRPVIRTDVALAGQRWPIELTLTARDNMKFRMLLGRTAMQGRITIDPEVSFLQGRPARKRVR